MPSARGRLVEVPAEADLGDVERAAAERRLLRRLCAEQVAGADEWVALVPLDTVADREREVLCRLPLRAQRAADREVGERLLRRRAARPDVVGDHLGRESGTEEEVRVLGA